MVAVALTACGGSTLPRQPQISTAIRGLSQGPQWLYTFGQCHSAPFSGICILSYPNGKYVGWIEDYAGSYVRSLCSDGNGDLFVTINDSEAAVVEYLPHGTKLLNEGPYFPAGCAVDAATGNVAVANVNIGHTPGFLAIFVHGKGHPRFYKSKVIYSFVNCGYDADGNLFGDGTDRKGNILLGELPKGSKSIVVLQFSKRLYHAGPIQWDGSALAIGYGDGRARVIYQVRVSGSTAQIVGTTILRSHLFGYKFVGGFFVVGNSIVAAYPNGPKGPTVAAWPYPAGGNPQKILTRWSGHVYPSAITVTAAQ